VNAALNKPSTQQEFFPWAQAQDIGYEFDGTKPVAINGWTAGHSRVSGNVIFALSTRLRGRPCEVFSMAGIETINKAVRYPDALVTCCKVDGNAYLVPDVLVVFEVVGPGSNHIDRIVKFREYTAVRSIRRYVIVESSFIGLTNLERSSPDQPWQTSVLTGEDILQMPEIDIEIPVAKIYSGIEFSEQDTISE
jgi:Uma2 family endonuclease